jgi:outer membrane protein OmpA-like peptidoglycan-associated protein
MKNFLNHFFLSTRIRGAIFFIPFFLVVACAPTTTPVQGPDKAGFGLLKGAAVGAGSGAVTGAQLSSITGPGAVVGAGFGAATGFLKGALMDEQEEVTIEDEKILSRLESRLAAQQYLLIHYQDRERLKLNRDFFPANWFFEKGEMKIRVSARHLVAEIAKLSQVRNPASRILVTAYVTAPTHESEYSRTLAKRRSTTFARELIRQGVEPRRLVTRGIVMDEPILADPAYQANQYREAIELDFVDG